jgi:hypothetical protein
VRGGKKVGSGKSDGGNSFHLTLAITHSHTHTLTSSSSSSLFFTDLIIPSLHHCYVQWCYHIFSFHTVVYCEWVSE